MIKDVFSALKARRAASYLDSFVCATGGVRQRRGLDVEIDVVGDEEIEMPVAVIVEKGAAGVPTGFGLEESSRGYHIGEGSIAVIAVEGILAVIRNEEVIPSIVVVIADTAALAPSSFVLQAGAYRHICKGTVAVVFEQMALRLLPFGKAIKTPSIDKENIEPVVVVVIVKGHSAAGRFEEVFISVFPAVNGLRIQAGLARYVNEADAQRSSCDWRRQPFCCGPRFGVINGTRADL